MLADRSREVKADSRSSEKSRQGRNEGVTPSRNLIPGRSALLLGNQRRVGTTWRLNVEYRSGGGIGPEEASRHRKGEG